MRSLFITKSPPYPPMIGGNQRSHLIYQALSKLGTVDLFLALAPDFLPENHLRTLKEEFRLIGCAAPRPSGLRIPWQWIRPVAPLWVDRVAYHTSGAGVELRGDAALSAAVGQQLKSSAYDWVINRQSSIFAKCGDLSSWSAALDVDDLDSESYRSQVGHFRSNVFLRLLLSRHLRQLERVLPMVLRRARILWVANESNRLMPGLEQAVVLPNIPFGFSGSRPIEAFDENRQSRMVLSIGTLSQKQNIAAIGYFLGEVWPFVRQVMPDAEFHIVGSDLREKQRAKWSRVPGVKVVGFVPDLSNTYRDCAFTVAPMVIGAGTNIKLLESLAYGRTCAATAFAQRGYETTLKHGEALWVAASAMEMCQGCINLLRDPDLRHRLSRRGAAIVRECYSFERFCRIVRESISDCGDHPVARHQNRA